MKRNSMFSVIQNPIDDKLTILRDDKTGFYNLSKTLKQHRELYPTLPQKQVSNWTRLEGTKALIEAVSNQFGIDEVRYELRDNTRNDLTGTYVHPVLHIQFMVWLDSMYLTKVMYSLYELNQAQGDVVLERIGEREIKSCIVCDAADEVYEGHCTRCWMNTFPEKVKDNNYRSKEQSFMAPLRELYPDMTLDKRIEGGCSKRRPDGFIDVLTHVVIVEIDEDQHRSYNEMCENRRMMELSVDVAHRPIVFIRLNPDEYVKGGELIDSAFHISRRGVVIKRIDEYNKRLEMLKQCVEQSIDDIPTKSITIIKLCFNE